MTVHHIVPPYLLEHLERTADDPNLRARYRQSLEHDAVFRARPAATPRQAAPSQDEGPAQGPRRLVHDAENRTSLPGTAVRAEGEPATADPALVTFAVVVMSLSLSVPAGRRSPLPVRAGFR